ncbi:hypothetical protein BB560_004729, partial [Smittium megazygosporum]
KSMTRFYIIKAFIAAKNHLHLVQNAEELAKRVLRVLDTDDKRARSLTLNLIASAAIIFSTSTEVQYKILQYSRSSSYNELEDVINTVYQILFFSPQYLNVVWDDLTSKLSNKSIPSYTHCKILKCLKYSRSEMPKLNWVSSWCESYISEHLVYLDTQPGTSVPSSTNFNPVSFSDTVLLECLGTWEYLYTSPNARLSTHQYSLLFSILKTRSFGLLYYAVSIISDDLSKIERERPLTQENIDLPVLRDIAEEIKNILLLHSSCYKQSQRRLSVKCIGVLKICSKILNSENYLLEILLKWSFSDPIYKNVNFESFSHSLDTKFVFDNFDFATLFKSDVRLKVQVWKIYKSVYIANSVYLSSLKSKSQPGMSSSDLPALVSSVTKNLVFFGLEILLFLSQQNSAILTVLENGSNFWLRKILKLFTLVMINLNEPTYYKDFAHLLTMFMGFPNSKIVSFAIKLLSCLSAYYPGQYLKEIAYLFQKVPNLDNEIIFPQSTTQETNLKPTKDTALDLSVSVLFNLVHTKTLSNSQIDREGVSSALAHSKQVLKSFTNELQNLQVSSEFWSKTLLQSDVMINIMIESSSTGHWGIITSMSRYLLSRGIPPSLEPWWLGMLNLSLTQNFIVDQKYSSDNYMKTSASYFRAVSEKFGIRNFQYMLVKFLDDAYSLLHDFNSAVAFNTELGSANYHPTSCNRVSEINSSIQFFTDICLALENCRVLQFSHIFIDSTTMQLLGKWEAILLQMISQLESGLSNGFNPVSTIYSPELFLGRVFTFPKPNLAI